MSHEREMDELRTTKTVRFSDLSTKHVRCTLTAITKVLPQGKILIALCFMIGQH